LLATIIVGIWVYVIFNQGETNCIQISDSECLQLERVSTPEALEKGLSGRESMLQNQGMLFTFPQADKHCIWMKDMRFSLDIIWADADKKVVDLRENVSPQSYPEIFCPNQQPALYVIEVNAGVADKAYLSPGSQLQF